MWTPRQTWAAKGEGAAFSSASDPCSVSIVLIVLIDVRVGAAPPRGLFCCPPVYREPSPGQSETIAADSITRAKTAAAREGRANGGARCLALHGPAATAWCPQLKFVRRRTKSG